jgi:addiction module RelE/StbE family toxin
VRLAWTPEAIADRHAVYDHIAAANPRAAQDLDRLFQHKIGRLLSHPLIGRPSRRLQGTRELVVHQNYVVAYNIRDDVIRILRLLHTSRLWPPGLPDGQQE